jgi:hypothetical protein
MKRVHVVWVASLTVIFAVAALGVPHTISAADSCIEEVGCGSAAACEYAEGMACDVDGCEGTYVCSPDVHEQCTGEPGCYDAGQCGIMLCVDWLE